MSAGEASFHLGQPERAEQLFAKALRQEPGHADALHNLGVVALHKGRFVEAEEFFLRALSASEQREARRNLAILYRAVPELTRPGPRAAVFCPCCCGHFPEFISGGPRLRPRACCPCCGSLERHRLTWLYPEGEDRLGFGQEEGQSQADYARLTCSRVRPLLAVYARACPSPSLLGIRYEDLMLDRRAALGRIFDWLGLPVPEEEAGRVGVFLERHGTSGSPAESVGRWRRELDPEIRELFLSELGPVLEAVGYDPV